MPLKHVRTSAVWCPEKRLQAAEALLQAAEAVAEAHVAVGRALGVLEGLVKSPRPFHRLGKIENYLYGCEIGLYENDFNVLMKALGAKDSYCLGPGGATERTRKKFGEFKARLLKGGAA